MGNGSTVFDAIVLEFRATLATCGSRRCAILITVSANATVPSTTTLFFLGAGVLTIANGVTLTIAGPIVAPNAQTFAYTGTGTTSFGRAAVTR